MTMTSGCHNIGLQLPESIVLEGVVTTLNGDATPHIAPMGPIVSPDFSRIRLRPFRSATTYENLQRTGQGVMHVTDDVELIAYAAVRELRDLPALIAAKKVDGLILADACRWYEFRVLSLDASGERAEIVAEVVESGQRREFFGFNRAKHAVLEAAILATRTHLLDRGFIEAELGRLATIVDKTGGHAERRAFTFLLDYLRADKAAEAESR